MKRTQAFHIVHLEPFQDQIELFENFRGPLILLLHSCGHIALPGFDERTRGSICHFIFILNIHMTYKYIYIFIYRYVHIWVCLFLNKNTNFYVILNVETVYTIHAYDAMIPKRSTPCLFSFVTARAYYIIIRFEYRNIWRIWNIINFYLGICAHGCWMHLKYNQLFVNNARNATCGRGTFTVNTGESALFATTSNTKSMISEWGGGWKVEGLRCSHQICQET